MNQHPLSDIKENFNLRREIGYCPQEHCLFDNLTVEEHLFLWASFKGLLKEH